MTDQILDVLVAAKRTAPALYMCHELATGTSDGAPFEVIAGFPGHPTIVKFKGDEPCDVVFDLDALVAAAVRARDAHTVADRWWFVSLSEYPGEGSALVKAPNARAAAVASGMMLEEAGEGGDFEDLTIDLATVDLQLARNAPATRQECTCNSPGSHLQLARKPPAYYFVVFSCLRVQAQVERGLCNRWRPS